MRAKLFIVKNFAGGFFKQLLCALCIILLVFFASLAIHYFAFGKLSVRVSNVVAEMVSPVPFYTAVNNSDSANCGSENVNTKDSLAAKATSNGKIDKGNEDESKKSEASKNQTNTSRQLTGLFLIYLIGAMGFSGVVIAFVTNYIRSLGERYKSGEIQYYPKNHVVVLGYGDITIGLLKHVFDKWPQKTGVMLQVSDDVQQVYQKLSVLLNKKQMRRLYLVHADRNNELHLKKKLRVQWASRIYILGDENEINHDTKNLDVIYKIAKLCKAADVNRKIPCSLLLNNQSTFHLFQTNDWSEEIKKYVRVYPYNFYTNWAHKVLTQGIENSSGIHYPSLDFEGIKKNDTSVVHLMVVGMTPMGMAMTTEAARIAHFPNFANANNVNKNKLRTRITLIDNNAFREAYYFVSKYATLFNLSHWKKTAIVNGRLKTVYEYEPNEADDFLDIEWEFIEGDIAEECLQEKVRDCAIDGKQFFTIACCLYVSQNNMAMGYYLPHEVYDNKHNTVLIHQHFTCETIKSLQQSRYRNVYPFGMVNEGYENDYQLIKMAQCVNWCYANTEKVLENGKLEVGLLDSEKLEEMWEDLSMRQKFSNVYNALTIPMKKRSMSVNEEGVVDDEYMPEVEHNRWNIEELLFGYRPANEAEAEELKKNGKTNNENRGVHLCIAPYNKLDEKLKSYDIMIAKVSLEIYNQVREWLGRKNS